MASAYDEIKKALALLRRSEPLTEQSRAELNRVRSLLERQVATAELFRNDPQPVPGSRGATARDSLASQQASEP